MEESVGAAKIGQLLTSITNMTMKTMHNRIHSGVVALFVLAIVTVLSVPSFAFADGRTSTGGWGQNAPISIPKPTQIVPSTFQPLTNYSSKPLKSVFGTKPVSTNSCYSCGNNSGYLSASRSTYLALSLDFSDNDIDQRVDNSITNNVNVNGNNNNVGINNSQETNQNAGITTSKGAYTHPSRSSYYDYFRRMSSNTGGTSISGSDAGQTNNTHQSNIFNSNKSNKNDKDKDDDNDDLRCELDASDTSVDEGDRITLEWETEGADDARINQGIGAVDEDGGTERVEIEDDTTFRLTVENDDGDEETCSVTVRVNDENDFSNVVIDDEPVVPPQYPYSGVYLSDLPYTGLDLGPYAWAYWAAFAGLGAAGAYVIFFMGIPFVLRRAGAISDEVETELAEENMSVLKSAMTATAPVTTTGSAVIASQEDITAFASALLAADNDTASDILEGATENGGSAAVFLNRASALLRSELSAPTIAENVEASVIEMLIESLETAAKARA